jgi:hypothetical protein
MDRSRNKERIVNHPNPFKDKTNIVFASKKEESAYLNVSDMSGRVVYSKKVQLITGENEFIIKKSDIGGAGVYVYEVKSPFQHSTNRMIIVD